MSLGLRVSTIAFRGDDRLLPSLVPLRVYRALGFLGLHGLYCFRVSRALGGVYGGSVLRKLQIGDVEFGVLSF